MKVKVGKYNYEKSTRKDKKLMTEVNGKKVHFGSRDMQHYKDKTGIWKELDHLDLKRRRNYLLRSGSIRNKEGKLTKDIETSPNYHSRAILW